MEKGFDLHNMVHTVHAMLQPKVDAKSLAFHIDLAPSSPRFIIADEGKLRQVLINLLNNAVKFTNAGEVSLSVWSEEPGRLHFCIADTGVGIAQDQIARLFKPFMQTDSALTQQEGTGLGLAISAAYVKLMGGDIRVASTVGEGTSFAFDIRCQAASRYDPATATAKVTGVASGTPAYRILIVDDVPTNRYLLRKHLEPLGFELAEAADGVEALALWESWQPHLIFLDIMLPNMDGFAVARTIRQQEAADAGSPGQQGQHVQVIAATASVLKHQHQQILDAGCDAVLTKPYTRQELYAQLRAALGIEYTYAEPLPNRATRPAAEPAPAGLEAAPACILVVDDNPVNQKVAAAMLKRLGYAVELAGTGQEALDALEARSFALVMLDLQMPVMGGLEAARRIRQGWGDKRPRLVAVTGGTTEEEQQECRSAGVDAWLPKPLQMAELEPLLARLLQPVPRQVALAGAAAAR